MLCNNAELHNAEDNAKAVTAVGDPLEVALLVAGMKAGLHRGNLLEKMPEVREIAFDAESKMMATFNARDDGYRVAVKGALDAVLEASTTILTAAGKTLPTAEGFFQPGPPWRSGNAASPAMRLPSREAGSISRRATSS